MRRHLPKEGLDAAADEKAYLKRGNSAIENDNYAEAIDYYRGAISIQPDSRAGHIGLGFALLQARDFTAAISTLKKAVAFDSMSADGYYMLGKAYAETHETDAAEEAWRRALALPPKLEHIYCDFCLLLFNKGPKTLISIST
ncbi:tetratricopeptide repeat protein [Variovorax sp. RT4R15]|uniref:tetratricopeptide repeat protein n=1 Tax=Variovorax sp. RT4R15 TaxID=3443737 RepID=UPI003F457C96